jgi:protein-L-isoaspartate(D-aspartate) O-methyltransferase
MDAHQENTAMVDGQIKPLSNISPNILEALYDIDRRDYIPVKLRKFSYIEKNILIGKNRYLPKAAITAKLLSALEIENTETILIISSTMGYSAALASKIAETVICIEQDTELLNLSEKIAIENSMNNIVFIKNELNKGYPDQGPYSCILIEGAIEEEPKKILDQLTEGGRLVTILNNNENGSAIKYSRVNGQIISQFLFSMDAPLLDSFKKSKKFNF